MFQDVFSQLKRITKKKFATPQKLANKYHVHLKIEPLERRDPFTIQSPSARDALVLASTQVEQVALASFRDSDSNAQPGDFSATVNWGGGFSSLGTIVANSTGGFDVIAAHGFGPVGLYPIAVTVTGPANDNPIINSLVLVVSPGAHSNPPGRHLLPGGDTMTSD